MKFFKRLFQRHTNSNCSHKPSDSKGATPPAVSLRPWGGKDATRLMIELDPEAFTEAQVGVAIEKGYVDTDEYEPKQWVSRNCSGLSYVEHHQAHNTIFITLEIDPQAVKPDSPYQFLISGYGGGEYSVGVFRLPKGGEPECLFDRSFCCK